MNDSAPKKVCLLGCGNIGSALDMHQSDYTLSHAGAIDKNPNYELIACVEPDKERRAAAVSRWNIQESCDTFEQTKSLPVDIYIIATPNETHKELLEQCLQTECDTIICEKPLVASSKDYDDFSSTLAEAHQDIIVNFSRRFDRSHQEVASIIQSGALGKLVSFHSVIGKGLIHNGSHFMDLLLFFFSEIQSLTPLEATCEGDDLYGLFQCTLSDDISGTIRAISRPPYSLFECDLIFENGRVLLNDIGLDIALYEKAPSKIYSGFNHLQEQKRLKSTLPNAMSELYRQLSANQIAVAQNLKDTFTGAGLLFKLYEEVRN